MLCSANRIFILCSYIILSPVETVCAVDSNNSRQTLFILAGSLHRSVELVHEPLAGDRVSRHLDLGVADAEAAAEAGRVVAVRGGQVDDVGQLLRPVSAFTVSCSLARF